MLPAAWVVLPSLPLTANGKVDRRALARTPPEAPEPGRNGTWTAPRTPVEAAVAAIWREVLGVERVGSGDDFFLLGGHSLSAIRVLSRLRRELGVELTVGELFEHTTLSSLAAVVAAAAPAEVEEPIAAGAGRATRYLAEDQLDALLGEMLAEEGDA
jgi:acyl carrier protein